MSAKYYENPTMLSRVTAKNVGDVFFETQCIFARSASAVTPSKDSSVNTNRK